MQEQLEHADAVIVQGHLGDAVCSALPDEPIIVDLYDPYLIENASYNDGDVFNNDLENWRNLSARGDFFLCASEQQRLLYSGF